MEVARSGQAAATYCAKSKTRVDGPLKYGNPPIRRNTKSGHAELNRRCLDEGVEKLVGDGTISIKEYVKFKRSVDLYKQTTRHLAPVDELASEWYYGETGTGKSKTARERFGHSLHNKAINKWFEGYTGQETVLLDDFGPEHKCLGHHLKQWADHYEFQAETKGGTTTVRPKRIVVTSNYHPKEIWGDRPQDLGPILRRFKVTHFIKKF